MDPRFKGFSVFQKQNFKEFHYHPSEQPASSLRHEEDLSEDCDFSDSILRYINDILMEEDMEDKSCMLQESLDLQAAEKSFYDVLGKKYPPSPEHNSSSFGDINGDMLQNQTQSLNVSSISQSSYSSSSMVNLDGMLESPNSTLQVPESIWQFNKGVEEASKFIPSNVDLFGNFESYSKGRKFSNRDDVTDEDERSSKQVAVCSETSVRSEMLDMVLLCSSGKPPTRFTALRESLRDGISRKVQQKGRGKKQSGKKEVVDLRTLLITCAQAVAAGERNGTTSELLKQIRQHSSPFGDGNQRLAHYLAEALEARLAGTGSHIYKSLVSKRTSAYDIMKAYLLYVAACPFRKVSHFICNKSINVASRKSMRLHVIDFGILYGFQWPTLIERLSLRREGPPKLRITGIDFPQPGFKPAERVEETGRRLAAYAEEFKVPFQYKAIAKKWETVRVEELEIEEDEFVVVNCLYRAKNLLDETVAVHSPRNLVLNLIRKINPNLFIHGIINGAYNAPFFVTRFREALFHFSSMFDMLDAIVPREDWERMLIEREILGREALNAIACESWERVERPETVKQWHARILSAGFLQQPFEREIVKEAFERVQTFYHKDFVIDEDNRWLVQGWKGRIIYALSAWKPE
ncbi:hypothetical protein ES332_A11G393900v1 [Gossypium tomentosum]|uniref:Uncharacterized protein n=1 Tax=Gossypium tomentosum TaxID=34277 RepID=A0A5D2NK89_GOSTO|nr:hypothetical protein ES332_A11G393900v1 [Gossypium tomentosum]